MRLGQPRDELLGRMTSAELSAWGALFEVQAEEAQEARDRHESGDGEVIYYGRDDEDDGDSSGSDGES